MEDRDDKGEGDRRVIVSKEADCARMDIEKPPLFICAPMVRYSKLPFRKLVSRFNCDLTYTPMIYAMNFVRSEECRAKEFSTDDQSKRAGEGGAEEEVDYPIVQFAAKHPEEFAAAAELVHGHSRGIDLNCGCPKRDVRQHGFGSALLDSPELIRDIVKQTRGRISFDPDFSVSVKIRVQYPIERTVDMCRMLEKAGVSHIAVHGRTRDQRGEKPDYAAIGLVKSALSIPVYANGDCNTYEQALEITKLTNADGVMSANGLLANPALFAGHEYTPRQCVVDWLDLESSLGIPFEPFHQHLNFMLRPVLSKPQRMYFYELNSALAVREFLEEVLGEG